MARPLMVLGFAAAGVFFALPAVAETLALEVEDAADHHAGLQGSYRGGLPDGWEWRFGTGRSAGNISGINALGLLAAHRLTGQSEHEAAALRAARALIRAYDGRWRDRRPHTQDIEFLAAAGYVIDAAQWFGVITKRWSAAEFVDFVIETRQRAGHGSLAGWDIASAIRAAHAVGEVRYARGLLDRLLQQRSIWDRRGAGEAQLLSRASLLWSLAVIKQRSVLSSAQERLVTEFLRGLREAQTSSGAWPSADGRRLGTQVTAYAVLGLCRWEGGKGAAAAGRTWLRRVADRDRRFLWGGSIWSSEYERAGRPGEEFISEIQSEVLQALASAS